MIPKRKESLADKAYRESTFGKQVTGVQRQYKNYKGPLEVIRKDNPKLNYNLMDKRSLQVKEMLRRSQRRSV